MFTVESLYYRYVNPILSIEKYLQYESVLCNPLRKYAREILVLTLPLCTSMNWVTGVHFNMIM